MENQKDKKKKKVLMPFGLRNKLMAAISMLLVSSIMLVSSTYAWFTLSTAPEVKGISTSVGANGNLEMALLSSSIEREGKTVSTFDDLDAITSAVGDSYKSNGGTLGAANLTWGNLVDLGYKETGSEKNYYGLDQITLLPARLNVTGTGKEISIDLASLLLTPKYGDDGRVIEVTGNTLNSAKYEAANLKFISETTPSYGVRAIGESADLTEQEAGLMAAKTAYNKYLSEAKALVKTAMTKAGENEGDPSNLQLLTNGIIALAFGNELETDQKTAINELITAVNEALDKVDAAYGEVLKAYAASVTADATTYKAITDAVKNKTTYTEISTVLGENGIDSANLPAELTAASAALEQQKANALSAKTEAEKAEPNYKTALGYLIDTDKVTVNGLSTVKGAENSMFKLKKDSTTEYEPDVTAVMNSMTKNNGGVVVGLQEGSGVVAYIGKVAGNYSANGVVDVNVPYGETGVNMEDVNTTIKTEATLDETVNTKISGLKAATATGATTYITNTYGYAVDLAFRTNAANSNLLLQTDGIQRIYDAAETSNALTQGAGSTMTFKKAAGVELNDTSIEKLMGAIRVVFFDPKEGTIYGIAALSDYNASGEEFTGKLVLKEATVDGGVLKLTDKADANAATLMALQQNTATRLSVLVYLDGDTVDNSMVANAEQSITGSLNLQFASDAELVPMKNAELIKG